MAGGRFIALFSRQMSRRTEGNAGASRCKSVGGRFSATFFFLTIGLVAPIAFGDNQHVSNDNPDGPGSFVAAVNAVGVGESVIFDPDVSGQTITLSADLTLPRSMSLVNAGSNVTLDVTDCTFEFGAETCNLGDGITFQAINDAGAEHIICVDGGMQLGDCSATITASGLAYDVKAVNGGAVTINTLQGEISAHADDPAYMVNVYSISADTLQINNCGGAIRATSAGGYAFAVASGDTSIGNLSGAITASTDYHAFGLYSEYGRIRLTGVCSGTVSAESDSYAAYAICSDGDGVTIDNLNQYGTITAKAASGSYGIYAAGTANSIILTECSGNIKADSASWASAIYSNGGTIEINSLGETGRVEALGGTAAHGIYGNGDVVLGQIDGTISATSHGSARAINANTVSITGRCNGTIEAQTTLGPAEAIWSGSDIDITTLGGTISATAGGDNDAIGLHAAGDINIDDITASGHITATATEGAATAVYGPKAATIGTLAGTVSANSADDACAFDTSSVEIGLLSGRIEATSQEGSALGLWPNSVTIGTLSGTIAVRGAAQSYAVYAGGFDVTSAFSGSITCDSPTACALGILTIHDIKINDFSGDVTTHGWGDSYGVNPWNGSLYLTGNTTGAIETTSDEGSGFGIFTPGTVTIENFDGTISAAGENNAVAVLTQAGYILFSDTATGRITASGNTGYAVGIYGGSDVVLPDFRGSISADGKTEAYGILADGQVFVGNMAGDIEAKASSGPAYGIYATQGLGGGVLGSDATSSPAVISGSISARGNDAYAVYGDGINITVADGATLYAKAKGSSGKAYAIYTTGTSANQVELVAGCNITGGILLNSAAADALVLSGSTGKTQLADDIVADTIEVTGGNWQICGTVSEDAELDISGGTVKFACQKKLKGNINVTSGDMSFDGTTTGTATVCECGVFGGTGTVGTLINNGTVAPGSSIGTAHVTGDYVQAAGASLEIEINDAGQCDLLEIGGSSTVAGTLNVLAENGDYKIGTAYTFLTAGGGVSGTFDTVTDNLPFLDIGLIYGLDYIQLLLSPGRDYDSEAVTFNQHGVARYLDANKAGASGDFATVLDSLNMLDADNARLAFDAMSGEVFGSLATIGIEAHEQFLRTIAQRLQSQVLMQGFDDSTADARHRGEVRFVSCQTCSPQGLSGWDPWVQGYGIGAAIAGDGNASGLGYSTGGVALGMERQAGDDTRLGVAAGYSSTHTSLDARADSGTIDGGQVAVYLQHCIDSFYLTGISGYGYNSYSTDRQIDFGQINRAPHAAYGGNNFSFYTEAGRTIFGCYAHLQPYAALEYIQLHENNFIETGADSIDIVFNGAQASAFRGLLGTRLLGDLPTQFGRPVTLEGRAAWRHEFLDENRVIDAMFAGPTGTAFAIDGVNVDRDSAILGVGLTCCLRSSLALYANYDVLTSQNYTAHAGSGGVQYTW